MKFACISDIGTRPINEDSYHGSQFGDDGLLLIVADGMGGHEKGEVASAMAVNSIKNRLDCQACLEEELLRQAVVCANQEIYQAAKGNDMGTTLVACVADEQRFIAANVGDSRLYHFDGYALCQITRDHSLVAELVANGELTERQARSYPYRNVITRALGTETAVDVDIFSGEWGEDQVLLLCSDGLTGSVKDEEMEEVLSLQLTCEETCQRLVKMALQNGATDNVTVVIARNERGASG